MSSPTALGQAFSNYGPRGLERPRASPGYPSRFSEIADVYKFLITRGLNYLYIYYILTSPNIIGLLIYSSPIFIGK